MSNRLAKALALTALAAASQFAFAQAPTGSTGAPNAIPGSSTLCGGMSGSALDDCLARQGRNSSGSPNSSALPPSTAGESLCSGMSGQTREDCVARQRGAASTSQRVGVPSSIGGSSGPSSVGGSTPGSSSVGGISQPNSSVGSTTGGAMNSSVGTMGSGMGMSGSGSSSGPRSQPSNGNVGGGSSLSR